MAYVQVDTSAVLAGQGLGPDCRAGATSSRPHSSEVGYVAASSRTNAYAATGFSTVSPAPWTQKPAAGFEPPPSCLAAHDPELFRSDHVANKVCTDAQSAFPKSVDRGPALSEFSQPLRGHH